LWPINENYGPQTQVEQTGLEYVAKHPGENYYAEEMLGGRSYFTAVYADRAILNSCIECHNQHPRSPRRDFKRNDIMGGIVVRVPLEF
jgi:cbb3-type cytochrome oxidase cytochrome c subunit